MKNFSELDTYDEDGNLIPFEETVTGENDVFSETGLSPSFTDGEKLLYHKALKKLTARQRQVILCMDYHGMSQDEAAEILQIERSVVSKHYKAALKKLRKICLGNK